MRWRGKNKKGKDIIGKKKTGEGQKSKGKRDVEYISI